MFVVVWAPVSRSRALWPAVTLLSFAIAVHLSHFPLAAALLLAGLAVRVATDPRFRSLRAAAPIVLRAGAPLVIAVVLVMAPNYLIHRRLVLSRSSSIFALAHLVGDGSGQRDLERACRVRRYALCAEREALQPDVDWFLWSATGPRARSARDMARGDSTFLREAPLIVAGTLRQEWPAILANAFRGTVRQVVTFGLHPGELTFSASVAGSMERLGPGIARSASWSAPPCSGSRSMPPSSRASPWFTSATRAGWSGSSWPWVSWRCSGGGRIGRPGRTLLLHPERE